MRFRHYDPYETFFAHREKAFRDSEGRELEEEHVRAELLEIGCEMAGYFGAMTAEKWQEWLAGVDLMISDMRANLHEASKFNNVKFVSPSGDAIAPEWINDSAASIVLAWTSLLRTTGFPAKDLVEVVGGPLGMVCFSEIDYALLGLQYQDLDAIQMTLDGGFTAAKILRVVIEIMPKEAVAANLQAITGSPDARSPTVVLNAIREGARLGGLKSAATRRQRALDPSAVVAAATALGWPAATAGVNKRLAARFDCTPERIGQILRATK
jgi:hypothetical protein